ncbi:MAG TPA: coenzyme F420-0:L-glutamate ligase [Candidatus Eisenbacteria bacterium]|nr:coenzyme F420-0:L-glutamate ligase [Candidatus Eisenbacteria bacterium]
MYVVAYKTRKVVAGDDLFKILEESLPKDLPENSVVAVASKIIALCEGRVADPEKITRDQLVQEEADYYLPRETNPFDVSITIKESTFIASAGVDQSNGNGQLVLWPKDVQESANTIREFLCSHFGLKEVGVIVTDSKLSPLRWGVTGVALSHSGFAAIRSYVGKKDVFGRELRVEQVNDADTLAAAAVGVMGEGDEQTPLAIITDIPFVEFVDKNPEGKEQLGKMVDMHHEVFTPILTSVQWKKGRNGK